MPSPEIVNTAEIALAEIPKTTVQEVHSKKSYLENSLKSFVLLIAVYALIINRAAEDKKVSLQPKPTPAEVKSDYTKAYVHGFPAKGKNSLLFNTGMPVIFYSNYIILK